MEGVQERLHNAHNCVPCVVTSVSHPYRVVVVPIPVHVVDAAKPRHRRCRGVLVGGLCWVDVVATLSLSLSHRRGGRVAAASQ